MQAWAGLLGIDLTSFSSIFKIQNASYKLSLGHFPYLLCCYGTIPIQLKSNGFVGLFLSYCFSSLKIFGGSNWIFSLLCISEGFFWLTAHCSRFFSWSLFFSLCLLPWQLKLWSGPFRFLLLCHKRFSLSASILSSLSTVCHTPLMDA